MKHSYCYVCDLNNPSGLRVEFRLEDGKAIGRLVPQREHQSFENVTHGGVLSALLDAAMNRTLLFRSIKGKTARLKVRFRREAKIGEPLTVLGELVRVKKSYALTRGEVIDSQNNTIAQGEAIFMVQPVRTSRGLAHGGRSQKRVG